MTKQKTQYLYRQGDILFKRIAQLPRGEQRKRDNGVVAYGEVTGHSHALLEADRETAAVFEIGKGLFVCVSDNGVSLKIDESADAAYAGATFVHEEHGPITLPPGNYEVVIQREYSPEAVRSVVD